MLITFLASKKEEQLRTGEMMVVEGVEMDLRGMEWFMTNTQGMMAMQDYMTEFMQEYEYPVVQLTVDYCACGHFYMKPTHVWTSMDYWVAKETQAEGTGRCRGRCPFGSIGPNGKWVHDMSLCGR